MAISSPLLEASIDGAHGVLLSVAGGSDLGLFEINEAAQLVADAAHPEANIIFGAVIDDALGDEVRVTVIAAGFDGGKPTPMRTESRRQPVTLDAVTTRPAGSQTATPAPSQTKAAAAPAPARKETPAPTTWKPSEPIPQRRTIVFDDSDDLDVPDFLK
jgi:cell division protein FtsZ